jgi:hypothetical protein
MSKKDDQQLVELLLRDSEGKPQEFASDLTHTEDGSLSFVVGRPDTDEYYRHTVKTEMLATGGVIGDGIYKSTRIIGLDLSKQKRIAVSYLLTKIEADQYGGGKGGSKFCNIEFDICFGELIGKAALPSSLTFNCDETALENKVIRSAWEIEFVVFEFGVVFDDKNFIKNFGIWSGSVWNSFDLNSRSRELGETSKKLR